MCRSEVPDSSPDPNLIYTSHLPSNLSENLIENSSRIFQYDSQNNISNTFYKSSSNMLSPFNQKPFSKQNENEEGDELDSSSVCSSEDNSSIDSLVISSSDNKKVKLNKKDILHSLEISSDKELCVNHVRLKVHHHHQSKHKNNKDKSQFRKVNFKHLPLPPPPPPSLSSIIAQSPQLSDNYVLPPPPSSSSSYSVDVPRSLSKSSLSSTSSSSNSSSNSFNDLASINNSSHSLSCRSSNSSEYSLNSDLRLIVSIIKMILLILLQYIFALVKIRRLL
jgi:hypothetical protein